MTEGLRSPLTVVVLTGLSGSGKTTALHTLEDAGFFCVDNLPSALIPAFLKLSEANPNLTRVALALDIRERLIDPDASFALDELRQSLGDTNLTILYLTAEDSELISRFKATRRPHPLIVNGNVSTIEQALLLERRFLTPFRTHASHVIDTSTSTVHDLRRRITRLFGDRERTLNVYICSFGFRKGLPPEADFVFDVRYLDNPYFVPELRPKTGLSSDVADYVLKQDLAQRTLTNIECLLRDVAGAIEAEGRPSLTVAIGCTGGQHRSVAMASALHARLSDLGYPVYVDHRDASRAAQS